MEMTSLPRLRHMESRGQWLLRHLLLPFHSLRTLLPLVPLLFIVATVAAVGLSFSSSYTSPSQLLHQHAAAGQAFNSSLTTTAFPPSTLSLDPALGVIRRPPTPFSNGSSEPQFWVATHVFFFLHIPKTAGQSFINVITYAARPYDALRVKTGKKREKSRAPRLDLTFMQRSKTVDALTPAQRPHFISAYVPQLVHVGHTDVLVEAAFRDGGKSTEYLTMLRQPVDRVISHFCYITKNASNTRPDSIRHLQHHSKIYPTWMAYVNRTLAPVSLESFQEFVIGQQRDGLDNWHTRAYAGCLHTVVVAEEPALCSSPVLMLEEAKRRLATFLFVGLTEHFPESQRLLLYTLHFSPAQFNYKMSLRNSVNSNKVKSHCVAMITGAGGEREAEMRQWVGQFETLDAQLYEYGREIFQMRMRQLPNGPHNGGAEAQAAGGGQQAAQLPHPAALVGDSLPGRRGGRKRRAEGEGGRD